MNGTTLWRSTLLALILCASPLAASAQEATISGTITDSTGGVLPGVTITATHLATGNTFVAVTDSLGKFRLPLRTGAFRVIAELPGFTTVTRNEVPSAAEPGGDDQPSDVAILDSGERHGDGRGTTGRRELLEPWR